MRFIRTRTVAIVLAAGLVVPALVLAQGAQPNPQCANAPTMFQDACQKTVDIFDYLAPELGTAVAGGNATLGQGTALGGLGHFSIGLRAVAVKGDVPQFGSITIHTTGATQDQIQTQNDPVPMASLELGVGLFRGLPLGRTHVFAVDALANAFYLPTYTFNNASIQTKTPWKLGFGGRVGIWQESGWLPGLAVTYMQRSLPTTSLYAVDGSGDSLKVQNLSIKTTAWRATLGKHFAILGLSGGIGQDTYNASTNVAAEVSGIESSADTSLASPREKMTRTNYFGDVTLRLSILHITGEVGGVQGGAVQTYNTFAGRPANAFRVYAAGGIGFTL